MVSISCTEEVTVYLEKLNEASSVINNLEIQIEKSREKYKTILLEATEKLSRNKVKPKSCIEKARPYFEAIAKRENIMRAISRNSQLYGNAKAKHEEAKQCLLSFNENAKFNESDHSQLEGINLAIKNVNSCKDLERDLQLENERLLSQCRAYDDLRRQLESKFSNAIKKARSYFEMQASMKQEMQEVKDRIESLSELVNEKKRLYSSSMKHLEEISNQIHISRLFETGSAASSGLGTDTSGCRSFGVGAESTSSNSSATESHLNPLITNNNNLLRSHSFRLTSRSLDLSEPCSTRPTPPGQVDTESESDFSELFNVRVDFSRAITPPDSNYERTFSTRVSIDASRICNLLDNNVDCLEKLKFCDDVTLPSIDATANILTSVANPVESSLPCSRPSATTLCGSNAHVPIHISSFSHKRRSSA